MTAALDDRSINMKLYPLLVLFAFFGCGFHAVSESGRDVTSGNNYGDRPGLDALKLDLEVEPLILEYGETLFIKLTITNNTSEIITGHFTSGCIYGFSILTPEGIRVAPELRVCTMNAPTVKFEPGEVVVRQLEWRSSGSSISRGKYLVRAGFGESGMIESPHPIEIELR
jgi:hypothetical protein